MAKAYWVVCYRSITDPEAREKYTKLAVPAALAAGGRYLSRGIAAKAYEHGVKERTIVVEFESLAQAIAAHDSPAYQAALAVLGNGAERDLRIAKALTVDRNDGAPLRAAVVCRRCWRGRSAPGLCREGQRTKHEGDQQAQHDVIGKVHSFVPTIAQK
jgi:uncharacterized protein (DUF1330 family)